MTETAESTPRSSDPAPDASGAPGEGGRPSRGRAGVLRMAVALACAVLGFLLVAQVRATEELGDRLEAEREEDLTRILGELGTQADRLQSDVTDLRLNLLEFETSAEREQLALRSLQRRYDDLRILVGAVPVEGEGVVFTISDPQRTVTQELLVDAVQELRDAGAEAIGINGIRLLASSAFATRNERLLLDRQPLDPPYRIVAVGPADTIARALAIPGGAIAALELQSGVTATVDARSEVRIPQVAEPQPFVYGQPVAPEDTSD